MTYQIYKIIHLTGILLVVLSLGGLIFRAILKSEDLNSRKLGGLGSGIGLILALIGGFGMIAKWGFQGWIIGKILIWFALGGMIAVINRQPRHAKMLWWVVLLLSVFAIFLAVMKPF